MVLETAGIFILSAYLITERMFSISDRPFAHPGARIDKLYWLPCQFRDAGVSPETAGSVADLEFHARSLYAVQHLDLYATSATVPACKTPAADWIPARSTEP
jgi:hypothetical protein